MNTAVSGFFGKLPSRGDFVSRGLPKSFIEPWDNWLQAAMAGSRHQLGKSWQESYCVSPLWRFAISPGLCGSSGYAGVFMPSVDRVNRYYPLVIATALAEDYPLLTLPIAAETWFAQAEHLALIALEHDTLNLDAFTERVQGLAMPPTLGTVVNAQEVTQPWHCALPNTRPFADNLPLLASHLLPQAFKQPSLWWNTGTEQILGSLLLCEGLPPVNSFSALLSGAWEKTGWNKKLLASDSDRAPDESSAAEEEASPL